MPGNEAKPIRLLDYLTRLASLRAKIVRDLGEYFQILWIHEIPREKGCFAQAWGPDEEYDQDVWVEVQTSHEPELPISPEICCDWIDRNTIRNTKDLPDLLSTITIQVKNPEWKEGSDQPQIINQTVSLDDHPEVAEAWEKYVEQKWLPWAEQHNKWEKIHRVYSTLFAIHQEQLRLGEEYELVIGIGLLTWQTPSNQRARRHLIVANALLEFEARLGKFTVRPNPDGANLRPELDMLDIEEQPARAEEAAKDSLRNATDDPWEKNCVEGVLESLVHSINPHGEYHEHGEPQNPQYSEKPIVEYAPALILRKRSARGLTEVLKRIKKRIEDGEKIPPEFKDIAEMPDDDDQSPAEREDDPSVQIESEIYFPKASNEEQRRIIEKIRASSGVLVQGPPGTGKSHTIANLICHLLATGQRTLITAKTPRALQVLERLLPEELRPLCINLLGSGLEEKRSLEASVNAVLRKNEEWDEERAKKTIQEREQALHRLRKEKMKIENRLRAIREAETHSQIIADGAYRGTAAQIARVVARDENKYGWMTDAVPLDCGCPLSGTELYRLLNGLRSLTQEKKKELDLSWPSSIPSVQQFEQLVGQERKAAEQENNTSTDIDDDFLQGLSRLNEEAIGSTQQPLTQLLNEVRRLKSMPHDWIPDAVRDVSSGNGAVWQELNRVSEQIVASIGEIIQRADSTKIALPEDRDRKEVLEDALILKGHLANGGRMGWGPFCPKGIKPIRYIIKNIRVNGRLCDDLERVALLVDALYVRLELDRGWTLWTGRSKKTQGPLSLQFRAFVSLSETLRDILSLEDKINQCKEALGQYGSSVQPIWHNESYLHTLTRTCDHALARINRLKAKNDIEQIESPLMVLSARNNAHPVTKELLEAVRARSMDAFVRAYARIVELDREKESAYWVEATLRTTRQVTPNLAENLSVNCSDTCWDERIDLLAPAWRWAQARTWLQDYIRKEDAPSLASRERQIEDEISSIIAHIASLRSWSFCFSRMQEEHRRHMEAWQQEMRRLGKGTGKHAPRHRREAQKHLNQCREAVPAWVMPLHRVWDTVDPAPELFDVIVVDEASQCGFEAIPLFYLGKKILIVGDDKQISPDAVGIPQDAVNRLMEEYLHDFKFKTSFDVLGSLFQHGKLRYGTRCIALREHFRCMPEIIRFSNDLCYSDYPLIPLRQYGPDRLVPLNHVYLQNGYREGSQSQVINRPEAEAIVDKILELCKDERYAGKTMGVIVLQGEAQAGLVEKQLLDRLGAQEMEERRIICGNPYSFQGDERDIMFLSMVAAANERIGPLTMSSDERRFNVAASRARDQMWLFHSVTRNDLSASCLRRRLLEFFEETPIKEIAGIDVNELYRQAKQTNRSIVRPPHPFDSWFEVDVALEIASRNYRLIPQFGVAGKFIDLVIEGGHARLAVECDGDEFHGAEQYEQDTQRQRILERCGWVFYRISEAAFYANKDKALEGLWVMLEERGIIPQYRSPSDAEEVESDSNEKDSDDESSEPDGIGEHEELDGETANCAETVELGNTVVYTKEDDPDYERQALITQDRSNPEWGTINVNTPIAQALLGASVGEVVVARLPMGHVRLRIKEIKKGKL